jgi:hypothetical protein
MPIIGRAEGPCLFLSQEADSRLDSRCGEEQRQSATRDNWTSVQLFQILTRTPANRPFVRGSSLVMPVKGSYAYNSGVKVVWLRGYLFGLIWDSFVSPSLLSFLEKLTDSRPGTRSAMPC